jgi:superfamily II DNA/RNA helicase
LPNEKIEYMLRRQSGLILMEIFEKKSQGRNKANVRKHELKVLIGTDAASEGLNLQTLGTLVNLDLP